MLTYDLRPSNKEAWILDVILALFVHTIYNRFEPQPSSISLTLSLLVLIPSIPAYCLFLNLPPPPTFDAVLPKLVFSYIVFYMTLIMSIFLYRVSPFHPLAKFPGPPLARLSQLWMIFMTLKGKRHQYFKALHDKYGTYVRIGPNEISCTDANAIPHILGTKGLPKGPMWLARHVPGEARVLLGIRDAHEHRERRKTWNRGLNSASVMRYEESLEKRVCQLGVELSKFAKCTTGGSGTTEGITVDLASWFSRFAFDFMSDMAFGGGFDLMTKGDEEGIWNIIESGLREITILQHLPYLMPFLWKIPTATAALKKIGAFGERCIKQRIEKGSSNTDIFHYLYNEDRAELPPPSYDHILSDACVVIVAGSDSTSGVLANIFYNLLSDPRIYLRLREEVDSYFHPGETGKAFVDSKKLAEMPFLNAVINEGLRLYPAVPIDIQRTTLHEAKCLGAQFLPPGTAVDVPPYVIHRDERNFSPLPNVFWPDRWLPREQRKPPSGYQDTAINIDDVSLNLSAFIPFSAGPANCAGKNLAILELRVVISMLMRRFDMHFGNVGSEKYDPFTWQRGQQDWYVLTNNNLPVTLTRRM